MDGFDLSRHAKNATVMQYVGRELGCHRNHRAVILRAALWLRLSPLAKALQRLAFAITLKQCHAVSSSIPTKQVCGAFQQAEIATAIAELGELADLCMAMQAEATSAAIKQTIDARATPKHWYDMDDDEIHALRRTIDIYRRVIAERELVAIVTCVECS